MLKLLMNGHEISLDYFKQCAEDEDLIALFINQKIEVEGWSSEDSIDIIEIEDVKS